MNPDRFNSLFTSCTNSYLDLIKNTGSLLCRVHCLTISYVPCVNHITYYQKCNPKKKKIGSCARSSILITMVDS